METNAQQPAWELSKENIQPLKSGRKASKLATIAQTAVRSLVWVNATVLSDYYLSQCALAIWKRKQKNVRFSLKSNKK